MVTKSGHDTHLTFGPDRSRSRRVDDNSKGAVTTLQIDRVAKATECSTSGATIKSFYRRYITGIAIECVDLNTHGESASQQDERKDLQGSLNLINDSNGLVDKDTAGNKLV
ncbi:hypothetical protein [Microbulbifer sp. JMSA002]|uniref:hypothetical protein n=1 Tax=Microbulbifer sp. JMSA002 TaxID=3243368 RepID=UPI00403A4555